MSADCRPYRRALESLAWDDLPGGAERSRLEAHLAGCTACQQALAVERSITASLEAVGRVQVSVSVESRVLAALPADAPRPARPLRKWQIGVLVLVAAGGLLGAAADSGDLALAFLQTAVVSSRFLPSEVLETGRSVLDALPAVVQAAAVVGRAADAVLRGLALLIPPAAVVLGFVAVLAVLTFVAVRRERRTAPITRGNR